MSERDGREARLRLAAARTLARAAAGAESLAERAGEAGGTAGRAAPLARSASRRLESKVGYLESHELEAILGDLEAAVRRRPLRALALAFVAGYLARRTTRGLRRGFRRSVESRE